jgi:hypothetical protein
MQHASPDDDGNLMCWLCHRTGLPESFAPFVQKERLGRPFWERRVRITYYRCAPNCFSRATGIRIAREMKGTD